MQGWLLAVAAGVLRLADQPETCDGGAGVCADARACLKAVPFLSVRESTWLRRVQMPVFAWCAGDLVCCAERRPEFAVVLKLPGRKERVAVHENTLVDDLFAAAAAARARKAAPELPEGITGRAEHPRVSVGGRPLPPSLAGRAVDFDWDFRLVLVGGGLQSELVHSVGRTLADYGLRGPRTVEVDVLERLKGGVANGVESAWADTPFVVHLDGSAVLEDGLRYAATCSGALFGRFVFTAAHCFQHAQTPAAFRDPASWSVRAWSADDRLGDGVYRLHPVEITVHDAYDEATNAHDFAIVEVELPSFYRPPQAPALDARATALHKDVLFAGFGRREDGGNGELRTATLTTEACAGLEAQSGQTVRCAGSGPASPVSTCVGDSGGPVLEAGSELLGWVLTGTNSFGYAGSCGEVSKRTGISMIAANRDFIERTIPRADQLELLTWL